MARSEGDRPHASAARTTVRTSSDRPRMPPLIARDRRGDKRAAKLTTQRIAAVVADADVTVPGRELRAAAGRCGRRMLVFTAVRAGRCVHAHAWGRRFTRHESRHHRERYDAAGHGGGPMAGPPPRPARRG